jgi:hypothetical protein
VLSLILIKLFYFHRRFLHGHYIFVSLISFFIIALVTYTDSRAVSSRSADTSRSADLSHSKPFFIALGKRSAGATFGAGDNGELSKRSRKLANPSDRMYIAPSRRLPYQRCARRYITIFDRNFPFYFISDRRIRYIYYANINKKYFIIKFYYLTLFRYRADITFINRFLNFRFF